MFITEEDYRVVVGENALKVISRTSAENRTNAEHEAQEEIASYLRPKYDCPAVFAAEGEKRNKLIVMFTCDIALYTWRRHCRRIWAWKFARNATKEPSSGLKAYKPGR